MKKKVNSLARFNFAKLQLLYYIIIKIIIKF